MLVHRRPLALPVALVLALVAASPPADAAASVTLNGLSFAQASPGDLVRVAGSGFPAGEPVSVTIGDAHVQLAAPVEVATDGTLVVDVQVPAMPTRGTRTFDVRVSAGAASASADLMLRPALSPRDVRADAGERVTFAALGFLAGSRLSVSYDGDALGTEPPVVVTDENGTAVASFVVPEGIVGAHTLRVADSSANQGHLVVSTSPLVALHADEVSPGDALAFRGTGFHAEAALLARIALPNGSTVDVSVEPTWMRTDERGSWQRVEVRVPSLPMGASTLVVEDARGARAETDFRVVPSLLVQPASALPGASVRAIGTGWPAGTEVTLALDGREVEIDPPARAAANGSFAVRFTVPPLEPGAYALDAAAASGAHAREAPSFRVEHTPPSPTSTPPTPSRHLVSPDRPDGEAGWYSGHPTVVLFADEGDMLRHRMGEGAWEWYRAPILVPDGEHTVTYFATSPRFVDEPVPHSLTLRVDATPPEIRRVHVEGTGPERDFSATVVDAGSGVDVTGFVVSVGDETVHVRGEVDGDEHRATFLAEFAGTHRVTVRVTDVAGNVAERSGYAFDVTVDDLSPSGPGPANVETGTSPPGGRSTPAPTLGVIVAGLLAAARWRRAPLGT